jgi:hypothetical protein
MIMPGSNCVAGIAIKFEAPCSICGRSAGKFGLGFSFVVA